MLLTLLLFAKSMHLISSIKLFMRMPVIQLNMALQRKTLRIKAMLLQLLMTRIRKAIRVLIGSIVQREKQAIHINTARPQFMFFLLLQFRTERLLMSVISLLLLKQVIIKQQLRMQQISNGLQHIRKLQRFLMSLTQAIGKKRALHNLLKIILRIQVQKITAVFTKMQYRVKW